MDISERQKQIVDIVKKNQPITGDEIGKKLSLTRSALRTDFSILTKKGVLKSKPKIGYVYQEGKNSQYIGDIMSEAVYVDAKLSVYDTILQIFAKDVGTIFITENDNLVGIVSRKDLLKIAIGKSDINRVPINVIMTRMPNIIYCEKDDEIIDGVRKIIEHQIDSLPVVQIEEKDGKKIYRLIGRVTKTNITKLFLECFEK